MGEEKEPWKPSKNELEPIDPKDIPPAEAEAFDYTQKAMAEFEGQFKEFDGPRETEALELLRENAIPAAKYIVDLVNGQGTVLAQSYQVIGKRQAAAIWLLERVLGKPADGDAGKKWRDLARKLQVASQEG